MNTYSRLPVVISPRGSPRRMTVEQHNQIVYLPIPTAVYQQNPQNRHSQNQAFHPSLSSGLFTEYVQYDQIPNRQPYLDQQDSELFPSDLPYFQYANNSYTLNQNLSRLSNTQSQNRSFANPTDVTFLPHSSVQTQEVLPPPMSRQQQEEYEECVREIQFRKRIDSVDRWLDEKKQENMRDRGQSRDFLRQFDMIVCNRY